MKEIISTENAPKAIGPYSQAVRVGNLVFISGQIPINPKTGEFRTDIKEATEQIIKNIEKILEAIGAGLESIVKTTVFLTNMEDFQIFNATYEKFFTKEPPARSTVAVKELPKGSRLEIEAIAYIGDK